MYQVNKGELSPSQKANHLAEWLKSLAVGDSFKPDNIDLVLVAAKLAGVEIETNKETVWIMAHNQNNIENEFISAFKKMGQVSMKEMNKARPFNKISKEERDVMLQALVNKGILSFQIIQTKGRNKKCFFLLTD